MNTVTVQVDGTTLGTLTINPATVTIEVQLYNLTGEITATSYAFFDQLDISYKGWITWSVSTLGEKRRTG